MHREMRTQSLPFLHFLVRWWHDQAYAAMRAYQARQVSTAIPHEADWLCIHRYEGSWTDSGEPYYGGLQMDDSFMATYAAAAKNDGYLPVNVYTAKGTADHWTPVEQMWVAEAAYHAGRGFYPWPNTARYCGLL